MKECVEGDVVLGVGSEEVRGNIRIWAQKKEGRGEMQTYLSRSSSGLAESADLGGNVAGSCVMRETFEDYACVKFSIIEAGMGDVGSLTMNERPEVLDINAGLDEPG